MELLTELQAVQQESQARDAFVQNLKRELGQLQRQLKQADVRLVARTEEITTLRAAVSVSHGAAQKQVVAVQAQASCAQELVALQAVHAELLSLHNQTVFSHQQQHAGLQAELQAVKQQLAESQLAHQRDVDNMRCKAAQEAGRHQADMLAQQQSYESRLDALEEFKNSLLADQRAAQEQQERERAAWKAALASLNESRDSESALKGRLQAMRIELEATRRERDAVRASLRQPQPVQQQPTAMGQGPGVQPASHQQQLHQQYQQQQQAQQQQQQQNQQQQQQHSYWQQQQQQQQAPPSSRPATVNVVGGNAYASSPAYVGAVNQPRPALQGAPGNPAPGPGQPRVTRGRAKGPRASLQPASGLGDNPGHAHIAATAPPLDLLPGVSVEPGTTGASNLGSRKLRRGA